VWITMLTRVCVGIFCDAEAAGSSRHIVLAA
jgi:hypothetical protein